MKLIDRISDRMSEVHLSLRTKLILSMSAIAITLLISSIISMMEYRRMSTYVSESIAENINNINIARNLSDACSDFNLKVLTVIGDDDVNELPDLDQTHFIERCDSLRSALSQESLASLADSVQYSYSAYMLTVSLELNQVLLSDFIDSREWYFSRLQPKYARLMGDINAMSGAIYSELKNNSKDFDSGIYRSVIPGIVSVGVGLLLIMMLLFYILSYYVNPLYRMLRGLKEYRVFGKKYTVDFEGDDQLTELNGLMRDITESDLQLKNRISVLRNKAQEENKE